MIKGIKSTILLLLIFNAVSCGSGTKQSSSGSSSYLNVQLNSGSGGVSSSAINVSTNPVIVLQFSQPILPSTYTAISLYPQNQPSNSVSIRLVSDPTAASIAVMPQQALSATTSYTIAVSTNIKSINNQTLANNFTASFTTGDTSSKQNSLASIGIVVQSDLSSGLKTGLLQVLSAIPLYSNQQFFSNNNLALQSIGAGLLPGNYLNKTESSVNLSSQPILISTTNIVASNPYDAVIAVPNLTLGNNYQLSSTSGSSAYSVNFQNATIINGSTR